MADILRNDVIPPFLTKTYDMVDNPATDAIISWSNGNNSFVVWNPVEFLSGAPSQIIQAQQFFQLCAATQYLCGWLSSSQSTSSTLCMPAILEIVSTKQSEVKLMGH